MKKKKKILMYYSFSNAIGGPLTYMNAIMNSELKEKYDFVTCFQDMAPGGMNLKLLWNMVRKIKREQPDIVHIQGLQSEGFYGVVAAKLAGCKNIIMTVHGFAFDSRNSNMIKRVLYRFFVEPISIRLSDKIYTVCEYASTRKIMLQNAKKNNCGYIHNMVSELVVNERDIELRKRLNITKDEKIFIIVGRLTKEKGFDMLAKIIKIMNQKYTDKYRFLVVGDGEYYQEFSNIMNEEIIKKQVILVGQTNCVPDYLNIADVCVFPSYHENFPIALLEAGKMGVPSIAAAVGGIPEMIEDGKTGFLMYDNDPEKYAIKMFELMNNNSVLEKMKKEVKKDIDKRFSSEFICRKIEEIYKCLIK